MRINFKSFPKVFPGEWKIRSKWQKNYIIFYGIGEQNVEGGKIYLNNKSIEQTPIHLISKEGLGYLPQQRSVFNMTVYDNILGIAQISIEGAENQKAITEKLLDEFNLQHLRTLNASVLSGGEIRRLMMARVMINKPKIVLLDEPLAALDPLVIQDIQKYILKYSQEWMLFCTDQC